MLTSENERFKELRKILGYKQVELAEMLGVRHASISKIENGKIPVSKRIKLVLESKLNVNTEWLEKGEGNYFLQDSKTRKVIDRVGKVIYWTRLDIKSFCDRISYDDSKKLMDILAKGHRPDNVILRKILDTFREIREDWLLEGKGKMFKEDEEDKSEMKLYKEIYELRKERDRLEKENIKLRNQLSNSNTKTD